MTKEYNSRIFDQYESNQRRLRESQQIAGAGPLIGVVRSAIDYFYGASQEKAGEVRQRVTKWYEQAPRNKRIQAIEDTEQLIERFSEQFNPCRETEAAMIARRLTVIQKIVRADIAMGELAVITADILMGNIPLVINKGELVVEFRENAQVR